MWPTPFFIVSNMVKITTSSRKYTRHGLYNLRITRALAVTPSSLQGLDSSVISITQNIKFKMLLKTARTAPTILVFAFL